MMKKAFTKLKTDKGFTLLEIIIAAGIAVLLASGVLFALISYNRTMKMTEQDEYAKQVFVVAQNSLSELKSTGMWDSMQIMYENSSGWFGKKMNHEPSDYEYWLEQTGLEDNSWEEMKDYMYVISYSKVNMENTVLGNLLPYGSIAEVTRSEGQYFIEYNLKTATVYAVWYTDSKEAVSYEMDVMGELDATGRPSDCISEEDARAARKAHKNINDTNVMFGYFGGGMSSAFEGVTLANPDVEVLNGEELIVRVTDSNSNSAEMHTNLRLEVIGLESGNTATFTVTGSEGAWCTESSNGDTSVKNNVTVIKNSESIIYEIILDQVAYADEISSGEENLHFAAQCKNLWPGENLSIKAECYATDILAIPASRTVKTNSLFEWSESETDGKATVYITHMRHLENLSPSVSDISERSDFTVVKAIQKASVSWNNAGESLADSNTKDYTDLYVTQAGSGRNFDDFEKGSYIPVTNPYLDEYDGGGYLIYNVQISATSQENIGIFGSFRGTIKNVGITGYPFRTEAVTVYSGQGNLGGIAGSFSGNCINSFATVKIKSINGNSISGGIFGITSNSVIENCYSGGFTENNYYELENPNIEGKKAGGLVGEASNTVIRNCYTTSSVGVNESINADASVGGLAGTLKECTVSNCYCAAPVSLGTIEGSSGGVAGTADSSTVVTDSSYISAFVNLTQGNVSELGTPVKAQTILGSGVTAYPFDGTLLDTYPYVDPTGLGIHYGDWAGTECFVRAVFSTMYIDSEGRQIGANGWDTETAEKNEYIKFNTDDWQKVGDYWYLKGTSTGTTAKIVKSFSQKPLSYPSNGQYASYQVAYEFIPATIKKGGDSLAKITWGVEYKDGTWQ